MSVALRLVDLDPHAVTWVDFAACREVDPELWFPGKGGDIRRPKRICFSCPVRLQCLEDVLEWETSNPQPGGPWGVVGGLSAVERREIIRERHRRVA